MKFLFLLLVLTGISLNAQEAVADKVSKSPAPNPQISGMVESDRLMQEYMAKRAQRIKLREAAYASVKAARNDPERKRILEKLDRDQEALREEAAKLAGQYHAVEKRRREQIKASTQTKR